MNTVTQRDIDTLGMKIGTLQEEKTTLEIQVLYCLY